MTIDDLIALLEKAEGPSRELDHAIFEVAFGRCSHRSVKTVAGDADTLMEVCAECGEEDPGIPGALSHSIDAALTLIPKWIVQKRLSEYTGHGASHIARNDSAWMFMGTDTKHLDFSKLKEGQFTTIRAGCCSTPAIAICIAALKARKEQP